MSFRYIPWARDGVETRVMVLALDVRRYVEANQDRSPPLADLEKYRALSEPGTAIVSENFAALYRVRPGGTVTLPGAGGPVSLRVVGTVADFSCSKGVVMVDRASLGARFGVSGADVFSVTAPPGTDLNRLARSVAQAPWAAGQALVVVPHEVLRGHILGMVGRLYGVAYVQEVVAAVVSGLGVASALLLSVLQRRRELGLLRASGATPAQAAGSLASEAALMAVFGVAFGLAVGVALEWYVLRVVLFEETGFVFPVRVPWSHAALLAVAGVSGSLLAGLGPAFRAARLPIPEAVAYE
jgi:putative ABC transport system permease protein